MFTELITVCCCFVACVCNVCSVFHVKHLISVKFICPRNFMNNKENCCSKIQQTLRFKLCLIPHSTGQKSVSKGQDPVYPNVAAYTHMADLIAQLLVPTCTYLFFKDTIIPSNHCGECVMSTYQVYNDVCFRVFTYLR